jgi:hypothetical protein
MITNHKDQPEENNNEILTEIYDKELKSVGLPKHVKNTNKRCLKMTNQLKIWIFKPKTSSNEA